MTIPENLIIIKWRILLLLLTTILFFPNSVFSICQLSVPLGNNLYNFNLASPTLKFPHGILSEDGFYKIAVNGSMLWFQLCDGMVFNHNPPRCFGCEDCGGPAHCGMTCSALVANQLGDAEIVMAYQWALDDNIVDDFDKNLFTGTDCLASGLGEGGEEAGKMFEWMCEDPEEDYQDLGEDGSQYMARSNLQLDPGKRNQYVGLKLSIGPGYYVCTAIGRSSSTTINLIDEKNPSIGVSVKMSSVSHSNNCSLSVSVFCDSNGLHTPNTLETLGTCNYATVLRHPSGCAKIVSIHGRGWGWFSTLLIIILCLFAGYLLGGAVYRYYALGARGVHVIPNLEIWASLPHTIQGLYRSLMSKFRRPTEGHRSTYSPVDF